MKHTKTAGVLALQGDFEAHRKALEHAGAQVKEVRTAKDLESIDGLIIPGGESTTMLKVLEFENMFEPLRAFGVVKPIFGTCAGAILIAKTVHNPEQPSLQLMDIDVERNAYGRQVDSRIVQLPLAPGTLEGASILEAVFIRAPVIRKAGAGVRILATYLDLPVLAEQGRHMAATFHPELTGDPRLHAYFLGKL